MEGHRSNQIETAAKPQLIAVIDSVDENDAPASMWVKLAVSLPHARRNIKVPSGDRTGNPFHPIIALQSVGWTRVSIFGNGPTKRTREFIQAWNTTPT